MMIRNATTTDLLPASQVCARAFFDDNLFGAIVHPYRHQYPEDVHIYFLKRFRAKFGKKDNHFLVSINHADEIIGLAHWCRFRAGEIEHEEPLGDGGLPPNRAADPKMEDVIERAIPFAADQWSGARADSWYLSCLGVDPKSHGQGAGRQLVAWGFEQAAREGVGLSVIAAKGKEGFYQRCGYKTITGNACDGKGNPLNGVEGGTILFKDV